MSKTANQFQHITTLVDPNAGTYFDFMLVQASHNQWTPMVYVNFRPDKEGDTVRTKSEAMEELIHMAFNQGWKTSNFYHRAKEEAADGTS